MPMGVLVTGANGFVSAAAVRRLQQGGAEVLSAVRACDGAWQLRCRCDRRWHLLAGCVGGRGRGVPCSGAGAHDAGSATADPLAAFRRANTEGSVNCVPSGAGRGAPPCSHQFGQSEREATLVGQPFLPQDPAVFPNDSYGISNA